ncbi:MULTISPECIES: hypothetical protein [unclassified Nocardioides]|uniref:hypothetical protein n=1 Tax=unclassified Nocardioides TaxID=2615069 RepID=UPI000AA6DA3F|nr:MULTISPECIES: hypothetical protein [unclassified Nocardioides]
MAKGYSSRSASSSRGVSQARLGQRSGGRHSFGGYTKVNNGDGSFTMKKTGR